MIAVPSLVNPRQKIRYLALGVLGGFLMAVTYHAWMGWGLGYKGVYNTFLYLPQDRFYDFFNLVELNRNANPYAGEGSLAICGIYFPLGEFLFYPFTYLALPVGLMLYLGIFFSVWVPFMSRYFLISDKGADIFYASALTFLSYPFIFSVDRANSELYLFMALLAFCLWDRHDDKCKSFLALLALGCALAIKPFAGVFLLLLVGQKRIKDMLWVLGFFGVISWACLVFFEGSIVQNIRGLLANQKMFFNENMIGNPKTLALEGWWYGSSLFGSLKVVLYQALQCVYPQSELLRETFLNATHGMLKVYNGFCAAVVLLSLYVFHKGTLLKWQQLTVCAILMIILPCASGDYRLLHLFIGLAYFVHEKKISRYVWVYSTLWVLLLIPKNYVWMVVDHERFIGLSVLINPIIALIMMTFIFKEALSAKERVS